MKKQCVTMRLRAAAFIVCALVITAHGAADPTKGVSRKAERTAEKFKILDWQNRTLGEAASPEWLLAAARGNWGPFKKNWPGLDDKILKLGVATNTNRNSAQTIADVQYAARIANQLKQTVLTKAAISLGSDGEFDTVNDAATKSTVVIAGQEKLTEFWQLIETRDAKGKKIRMYNYYVVYACDPSVWDNLVAKYLYDVAGQLPDKKTQQTIAGMFKEIDAATKNDRPKTEEQFQAELAAQKQAIESGGMSREAQLAAYKSGDSTQTAAASVTTADANYVDALANLANAE